MSAIVHWACVGPPRADELVEKIVTWRDSAMRRHKPPELAAEPAVNANFHVDTVTQFYQEHPWLGENVAMSLAGEFAPCAGCWCISGCWGKPGRGRGVH